VKASETVIERLENFCSASYLILNFEKKSLILFEVDILIRFRQGYAKIENSTDFP